MKVLSGVLFVGVLAAERCAAATDDGFPGEADVGASLVKNIQDIAAKFFAEMQAQEGTSDSEENDVFRRTLEPTRDRAEFRRYIFDTINSHPSSLDDGSDMFNPLRRLMPIVFDLHDKRAELYSQMKQMATGLDGRLPKQEAAKRRRGLRKLLQSLRKSELETRQKGVAAITDPEYPTFFSEELKLQIVDTFMALDESSPFFKEYELLAKEK